MTFNLKSLSITNYNSEISDNVKFLNDIEKDDEISKNLSNVPEALEKSNGVNNLRLGIAYIVKDDDNLIGLFRLDKKKNQSHEISIDFAIHPSYRHQGYGTILLKEISDYILDNSTIIKKVSLDVVGSNVNCAKCAFNANFNFDGYVNFPDSKKHFIYSKHK